MNDCPNSEQQNPWLIDKHLINTTSELPWARTLLIDSPSKQPLNVDVDPVLGGRTLGTVSCLI